MEALSTEKSAYSVSQKTSHTKTTHTKTTHVNTAREQSEECVQLHQDLLLEAHTPSFNPNTFSWPF